MKLFIWALRAGIYPSVCQSLLILLTKLLSQTCIVLPFIHPSILPPGPGFIHSFIHVSSLFHTKYFPGSLKAGAFHYVHAYSSCAHANFEVQGFIRSKPQEGRWRIRDKPAARNPACSLVCASRAPGERGTSGLVALMIGLSGWKLRLFHIHFIRTRPGWYFKQSIEWQTHPLMWTRCDSFMLVGKKLRQSLNITDEGRCLLFMTMITPRWRLLSDPVMTSNLWGTQTALLPPPPQKKTMSGFYMFLHVVEYESKKLRTEIFPPFMLFSFLSILHEAKY